MSQTFTEAQYLRNTIDSFVAGEQAERERIIKLLANQLCECITNPKFFDDLEKKLGESHAYYLEVGSHSNCGCDGDIEECIELIKGENK